jgi:hypothetical protein
MGAAAVIPSHVAADFTPLYAGVPSRERAVAICARLNTHSSCRLDQVCLAVPGYDREKPGSSANRCWQRHGAKQFSRTAALVPDLLYEEEDPGLIA